MLIRRNRSPQTQSVSAVQHSSPRFNAGSAPLVSAYLQQTQVRKLDNAGEHWRLTVSSREHKRAHVCTCTHPRGGIGAHPTTIYPFTNFCQNLSRCRLNRFKAAYPRPCHPHTTEHSDASQGILQRSLRVFLCRSG